MRRKFSKEKQLHKKYFTKSSFFIHLFHAYFCSTHHLVKFYLLLRIHIAGYLSIVLSYYFLHPRFCSGVFLFLIFTNMSYLERAEQERIQLRILQSANQWQGSIRNLPRELVLTVAWMVHEWLSWEKLPDPGVIARLRDVVKMNVKSLISLVH